MEKEDIGLQTLTLKTLNVKITNALIIGIIIRTQNVKIFSDKKNGGERGVWNFTIRDSITDYINVTLWGSEGYVSHMQQKFCVGDVVDLMRPKINIRHIDDNGEQYRPSVTSPFTLTLNENQSNMIIHEGDNYHKYLPLLHYPTKPAAAHLTIADITNNGGTIRGESVDLLVAIQQVLPIKKLKTKKDGREIQKRDIFVLDQTHLGLRITLWEDEFIARANNWKPRDTILFLADMRVDWSNYERSMVAVPHSKTIITEDPCIPQVDQLKEYARTAPINIPGIIDQLSSSVADPNTITTIMTVQRLIDVVKSESSNVADPAAIINRQFTALLYVYVTSLDLDGFTPLTITRCERCSQIINKQVALCVNLECPVGSGSEKGVPEIKFDIKVDLTDHTGTLFNCKLVGQYAEKVLGVTATDFLNMSDDDKCTLKWKYIMERCAVRVIVLKRSNRLPIVSILSCEVADPLEVAAKLPRY